MKFGVVGTDSVGCAIALAAVTRGSYRRRFGVTLSGSSTGYPF